MAGSPARVHVIDDDEGIRTMLELALQEHGYVVTTSDGTSNLEAQAADIILLDARLGARSALGSGVRELLAGGPPIVVMTAASDAGTVAREIGAAGALAKPFDLAVLFETIDRCLDPAARPPARRG